MGEHGRTGGPTTTGAILGIVGGGQLARMLYQAAIPLGIDVRVFAARADEGAARVARDVWVGDHRDLDALARFAAACDVVTFDHELVDPDDVAALEAAGATVRPGARALRVAADKIAQRALFERLGLPVAPYVVADDVDVVARRWAADRSPMVVKTARGGYDGRGVWMVTDDADLDRFVTTGVPGPFLVEPLLALEAELATLVTRGVDGTIVHYPVVRTHQHEGMCRATVAPADVPEALTAAARAIACLTADALDLVGVLAVELFVVEGRLLLNELAPRTHNSGHYTIEACVTSQFENHLRAVLGLPLGPGDLRVPAAAMANLVGRGPDAHDLATLPASARVHHYGKADRPGRKVGHVTVCGDDPASVLAEAERFADVVHLAALRPDARALHPAGRALAGHGVRP